MVPPKFLEFGGGLGTTERFLFVGHRASPTRSQEEGPQPVERRPGVQTANPSGPPRVYASSIEEGKHLRRRSRPAYNTPSCEGRMAGWRSHDEALVGA